jgi:hypothetical protein
MAWGVVDRQPAPHELWGTRMPERAALIAVLILERPTCLPCIAIKAGLGVLDVQAYFDRIGRALAVRRDRAGRCRACGSVCEVFSFSRPA